MSEQLTENAEVICQRIRLSGQLVRVDGDDGFTWSSSLSREDTGNGACELIWIEQLSRLD